MIKGLLFPSGNTFPQTVGQIIGLTLLLFFNGGEGEGNLRSPLGHKAFAILARILDDLFTIKLKIVTFVYVMNAKIPSTVALLNGSVR